MPVTQRFQSAGLTDPGRKRSNNEDRFYADADHGIFIVADGMGGEAAGETAAELAVNVMRARLERDAGTPAERMREAIALANNEIFQAAQKNPAWRGMACVLTAALVAEDRVTIGHVGDSRLYLLGQGSIRKITPDHSPVGEREDSGDITESEAMQHPRRNEVFRDVGSAEHRPDDANFIEILTIPFQPDQAILICSDGLSDLITAEEIRRIVEKNAASPRTAVQGLIDAANRAGGKDNVTALLVENSRYSPAPPQRFESIDIGNAPSHRIGLRSWIFIVTGILLGVIVGYGLSHRPPRTPAETAPPLATGSRTWLVGQVENADFPSISTALDKAQPGDRVMVAPGQYLEQVKLRNGIDLISQQPGGAVLQSNLGDAAVVATDIQGARLAGFRIVGDAQHALAVGVELRNSSVRLEDLDIAGTTIAAIEVRGNSAPNILACRITGKPQAAIALYDAAHARIAHSQLSRAGVKLHDQAAATQVNNTVTR